MKKETVASVSLVAVSLVAASVCHFFFPGTGALLKPLLWPAFALPFLLRARAAVAVSALVPLLSAAVNGMPAWTVAGALAAASAAVACALAAGRFFTGKILRASLT